MAKRKAIGKFNWTDLIVPGLVIGGAIYLFNQLDLGDTGTTTNNTTVDQNTAATAAAALAAAKAAGIPQTVSDTTLNSLANTLFQQMVADPVDQSAVLMNLVNVNTQTDWQRLYQLFGTRKANLATWYSTCALTGYQCDSLDLVSFVKFSLDQQHRSNANSFFSEQGINASV